MFVAANCSDNRTSALRKPHNSAPRIGLRHRSDDVAGLNHIGDDTAGARRVDAQPFGDCLHHGLLAGSIAEFDTGGRDGDQDIELGHVKPDLESVERQLARVLPVDPAAPFLRQRIDTPYGRGHRLADSSRCQEVDGLIGMGGTVDHSALYYGDDICQRQVDAIDIYPLATTLATFNVAGDWSRHPLETDMTQADLPESSHQPVGLIIGAVAVTMLLASLGQTIVSTALPVIVGELGGLEHLSWVVTAYLLSSTVVAPIYGKLGDLYGRKVVLQAAIVIFLIGSTLSALSSSMTFLILARAVQGLGGGGLMVVAMTVVADVIPARQRGKVQGVFGAVFGVATVAGPLLGGVFVEKLGWHWIFLINLPLGLLALVVIAFALKSQTQRRSHRIDYPGFVLLTGALSSFVIATSLGGSVFAWGSVEVIGLFVLAMLLLLALVFVEARAAEPVLPLGLFRNNTFVITNSVGFLTGMAMFGTITFLPLYLQVAKGVSPTGSALQLIPMMVGLILSSTLAGFFMSRTGHYRILPILSSAVLVVGLLLLGFMRLDTPDMQVATYMFLVGIGIGPINSVGITATQNAVSKEVVGVATASASMFRQIGGAIGVSLFGALFSSGLAEQLGDLLTDGGISAAFSSEALASLSAPAREQMLEGFTSALHPVFFVGATVGVLAFALSLMLRELPLATTLRHEPEAELAAEEAAASAAVGGPASPPTP